MLLTSRRGTIWPRQGSVGIHNAHYPRGRAEGLWGRAGMGQFPDFRVSRLCQKKERETEIEAGKKIREEMQRQEIKDKSVREKMRRRREEKWRKERKRVMRKSCAHKTIEGVE